MKHSKEAIEEYQKVLKEYYKIKVEPKKSKELEPYLKDSVVTAINMCILLNKQNFIQELGKLLIQTSYLDYWDLDPDLRDIQKNMMISPFDEKKDITEQKTKQDLAKEKIVSAMEICHRNLPKDRDLVYKLAILLFKVDYLDYNLIKKGLMKIQKKYLTRLELHKKELAYVVKING